MATRPGSDCTPRLSLKNAWGHLRTVTQHKLLVARHCFKVGLYWRGIVHDMSKFAPVEFLVGAQYYQGICSPNAAERVHKGYSEAWLHHKGRNRHHHEYWIDIVGNGDASLEGKLMPVRFAVEMFCDRVAASKVYEKDAYTDRSPLEYYELEMRAGHMIIHPQTNELLQRMLVTLAEKGEAAAFRMIRDEVVRPARADGTY